ncbi:BZ3500_MvSof-1268-A1-R1_Chr5-2g07814 [Microbotryum saponariae]|uniref:BZ3500_MvSof-1268-A1-R1_Chr5-2g07814 protein n=1 Tax=Microbotryum saponariae TaxID=289078 RepID=A0A2X0KFT5_9BASI|nr:BZ3500_MvSof-1268-A1-R1_Chr5-2g07814 [Microbotryum saponariae]SDA05683.1 BZ3501_MvSof-1269-A2-R1_Chr5-2g07636 [Microbotryum saponariae]
MVRLNCCAGFGILLAVAFRERKCFIGGQIAQLNPSTIPRHLRIVTITTTGLAAALGNVNDLYDTASGYVGGRSVNGNNQGLRQTYEWGIWNYCTTGGSIGSQRSYCTKRSFGFEFRPALALLGDVPTQYEQALDAALPNNVFSDDKYLGRFTKVANYLVFIGSILAALAMLVGFGAHRFAFLFGAIVSLLAFLLLAAGAIIYTILLARVKAAINNATISGVAFGIKVAYGNALWLLWGATAAAFLAVIPYLIACCTGRNDSSDDY